MVGGELTALLGFAKAPAARREDHRACLDDVLAAAGAPARPRWLELGERRVWEGLGGRAFDRLAKRLRDRVAGAVAHVQQALPARAAAARNTVAAVLAGELDTDLLEPANGLGRLGGEDLDEAHV